MAQRPYYRRRHFCRGRRARAAVAFFSDVNTALPVAYAVVGFELLAIAWIRKRFLSVSLRLSLIQVTLGGVIVSIVGVTLGQG